MPNIKITINFDSEKLSAIKQFSEPNAPTIESQLQEYIEKIYAKAVPAPVRQYIDGMAKTKPQEKKKALKDAVIQRGDAD